MKIIKKRYCYWYFSDNGIISVSIWCKPYIRAIRGVSARKMIQIMLALVNKGYRMDCNLLSNIIALRPD